MIRIDRLRKTYTCPYCGHDQSYASEKFFFEDDVGFYKGRYIPCTGSSTQSSSKEELYKKSLFIHSILCANPSCGKITVVGFNKLGKQHDIFPQKVVRVFPDYIPEQIRRDYTEASCILKDSPKAAATLFRRCLQGMIRDFWGITKNRLVDAVDDLNGLVSPAQWNAIDGLRKIGNIGAHMENDVSLIVDIDEEEAHKLGKLIELLLEKWYIARHDEEQLYHDITTISSTKQEERMAGK